MKKINLRDSSIVLLIVLAALSRLLPHPFNFTPITAMALFGSAYFTNKYWAFFVPLLAMLGSDVVMELINGQGFYSGMYLVYGALALITLIGFVSLRKVNVASVLGSTLLGSVIFYLVTNFALFYPTTMYPHSWQGIVSSYTMAIPFFKNALVGDLFFSSVLFGSFYLLTKKVKALKIA